MARITVDDIRMALGIFGMIFGASKKFKAIAEPVSEMLSAYETLHDLRAKIREAAGATPTPTVCIAPEEVNNLEHLCQHADLLAAKVKKIIH